jgi:hypothetical protein
MGRDPNRRLLCVQGAPDWEEATVTPTARLMLVFALDLVLDRFGAFLQSAHLYFLVFVLSVQLVSLWILFLIVPGST